MENNLTNDITVKLWKSFIPFVKEIKKRASDDFISLSIYSDNHTVNKDYSKWATVEVENFHNIPKGLNKHTINEGLYAVATHIGSADTFYETQNYILNSWLPGSSYILDNREHFEVLPVNYNPMDPNATEELWVPIKPKKNGLNKSILS